MCRPPGHGTRTGKMRSDGHTYRRYDSKNPSGSQNTHQWGKTFASWQACGASYEWTACGL